MPNHLETREAAYGEAIRSGRLKMLLVLAVCAAPVIASYVSFYFLKPEGRTNYGTLVEVKPLPAAALTLLDGKPFRQPLLLRPSRHQRMPWPLPIIGCARNSRPNFLSKSRLQRQRSSNDLLLIYLLPWAMVARVKTQGEQLEKAATAGLTA